MTTTAVPDSAPVPAARFGDLLVAEWIKLRSLRSTYWALGAGALAVIAFNANAARVDAADHPRFDDRTRSQMARLALRDAFTDGSAMILVLAVASIGAITIVGEYSTGLVRTTFAAVPDRRALMAAKAALLTAVMTVYGALVAGASFASTQAILATRDAGVALTHPGAARVVCRLGASRPGVRPRRDGAGRPDPAQRHHDGRRHRRAPADPLVHHRPLRLDGRGEARPADQRLEPAGGHLLRP
ncbi:hypothetical protein [Streptomyces sp. NBC_00568]|uniref:hypothetical protein n=1 Tax=Streptomyces sp. NBC_00568 TaxID=2975779 RepID=UPI002B1D9D85|nr:hypothetical protein [Streptomyces sp. NBC_00568]